MIAAIKSIIDTINQALQTYRIKLQAQTTTEVVKDKRALKKASNITEQILLLTDKYKESFSEDDLKYYEKLKRKFLKCN